VRFKKTLPVPMYLKSELLLRFWLRPLLYTDTGSWKPFAECYILTAAMANGEK
jgi:hypothetical protein